MTRDLLPLARANAELALLCVELLGRIDEGVKLAEAALAPNDSRQQQKADADLDEWVQTAKECVPATFGGDPIDPRAHLPSTAAPSGPRPLDVATPESIERARALAARFLDGNELEIDDGAPCSSCAEDAGQWVQAWLWLPDPEPQDDEQRKPAPQPKPSRN